METGTPEPLRLLIVPGLHDSPPGHWQSWLQSRHPRAVRVQQRDWTTPDLEHWAARVGATLERSGPGRWLVAGHSFGVLALLRHLQRNPSSPVVAALLVAPADPDKFGVAGLLPAGTLPLSTTMVLSANDPWLPAAAGQRWARRWGCQVEMLGAAGHINMASGFGPLPLAERWLQAQHRRLATPQELESSELAWASAH
jgi:predicted alpha/beta hydrolase family esterase